MLCWGCQFQGLKQQIHLCYTVNNLCDTPHKSANQAEKTKNESQTLPPTDDLQNPPEPPAVQLSEQHGCHLLLHKVWKENSRKEIPEISERSNENTCLCHDTEKIQPMLLTGERPCCHSFFFSELKRYFIYNKHHWHFTAKETLPVHFC